MRKYMLQKSKILFILQIKHIQKQRFWNVSIKFLKLLIFKLVIVPVIDFYLDIGK